MEDGKFNVEVNKPKPIPQNSTKNNNIIMSFIVIVIIGSIIAFCIFYFNNQAPDYGKYETAAEYADSLITIQKIETKQDSLLDNYFWAKVHLKNNSESTIKYISFKVEGYNRVGDKVSNYTPDSTRFVGPIYKDDEYVCSLDGDFANSPVHSFKFIEIKIEYTEESIVSFDSDMLKHINS